MKIRALLCGGVELAAAAAALGVTALESGVADVALVDLRDPGAVAKASLLPPQLPRIVVAEASQLDVVTAVGVPRGAIATTCEPAVLGPLIAAALPASQRRATRSVLVTSVRGGTGRSLLVANLARRLAPGRSVLAVDATGSAGLAAWLGSSPTSWRDLEGLEDELTAEHLAVVAVEPAPGLRVLGGPPSAPTSALCRAAVRAGLDLAEMVLVDGPNLAEPRTQELISLVDRVVVLTYDDPISLAALDAADVPATAWLVASQSRATALAGRDVFRALPRADADVAGAASAARAIGGALGAAYDELAALIVVDAS